MRYDTLQPQLNQMLKKFKSKLHVVAHTPLKSVSIKYHGKLATTDLDNSDTELLLLVANGKKYQSFKIDIQGDVSALQPTP